MSIKLIHTLKSKIGMSDSDYRQLLRDRFGAGSSKDLAEPELRMLACILRGLSESPDPSDKRPGNLEHSSRKIWRLFYRLQEHIGRRDARYLAGFIGKACGEECRKEIQSGARLDLDLLEPQNAQKVIEALKFRLAQEEAAGAKTLPALDEKARAAGIKTRPASPVCRTSRTKTKEEEDLDAELAAVPF